jgi:oligoribonuclease NrnB/cAMP/cGMP phosphodiesterase (DHH superfamily)
MKTEPTIFFHGDLDGIVSYLLFCWFFNKKLPYVVTTPLNLEKDYNDNIKKNSDGLFYFLDLDVTKIATEIDKQNVVIFDHHKTNVYKFQKAKAKIVEETSCSKLIYDSLFKDKIELAQNKKLLVALANDWDSHKKTNPLSEELNIVLHSTKNKYHSFIEDYYDGFKPFDKFKQNAISLVRKYCKEYISTLEPYFGTFNFDGVEATVGAIFCEKFIAECCDFLFTKYNVDIAIAVMLNKKRIAVRRNANNAQIDVSKFVQKIAGGGGHEAAAGGNITEEFIDFTKLLKPIQ